MNTHREYSPSPDHASFDAFASEYTKVRDELPEQVRKPLDVFREEVMEICKAHGVDHPSKLVTPEAHASAETLKHVSDLLDDILSIFETKEVPLGHKDWEVKIPKKYSAENIVEKNGKTVVVMTWRNNIVMFDSSGAQTTCPSGYLMNDKLAIIGQGDVACAIQGERWLSGHIYLNGVETDDSRSGYSGVLHLLDMNGQLVYVAYSEDLPHRSAVVYKNGEVYGSPEGYEDVSHVVPVGDQLALAVKKEGEHFFCVYLGGKVVGKKEGYTKIVSMTCVNGKLTFTAELFDVYYLVHNGETVNTSIKTLRCVQSIANELSWVEESHTESELFIGGRSYAKFYAIETVVDTGGEPLVIAKKKDGDPWQLMWGDEVIGRKEGYQDGELSATMIRVGDQILFMETKKDETTWKKVTSSAGAHFGSYSWVCKMKVVDDKHFIVIAEEDGKVVQRTFDIDHPPYQGEGAN